ncbi:MAG: hypothetical protein ACK5SX_08565 [Sandaracinobacter sp.]
MSDRSLPPGITDIAAGVILAIAGLLSAWATFQAALWGGNQAAAFTEANRLQTEASRLEIIATQRQSVALTVAHAWLDATLSGDATRATFYERHLQPHQRKLFEEWRAQLPADIANAKVNSNEPPIPLPDVLTSGREAAQAARAEAEAAFQEGQAANAIGDRFTLATVLLSLVLFLAGTGQLLRLQLARNMVIALSGLILLGAAGYALSIPRAPYLSETLARMD